MSPPNALPAAADDAAIPAGKAVTEQGGAFGYATLALPLTAALCRAGVAGLSMGTPGHRGGRIFGAWQSIGSATPQ